MSDSPLNIYLREIMKFKVPSHEEERELIEQMKKGDFSSRDKLIVRHLQSVVKIAKLYHRGGVPLDDLIDEGNLGLIRATKSYNLNRGVKFISYASWWIKHYIHRAIYQQMRMVRIPINKLTNRKILREMEEALTQELGRLPSSEEIAEALGISVHEVNNAMKLAQTDLSLDLPIGEEETSLLEFIRASPERLEDSVVRELLAGELEASMSELTDIERLVLKMRFGLDGELCHTLKEIGEVLNLSRERVRQIEEKALKKLRKIVK